VGNSLSSPTEIFNQRITVSKYVALRNTDIEKQKARNNELIKIQVERMSKQVGKIAAEKFTKYKFEIVSILSYLRDIG
jgi:hypothetical protein